MEEFEKAIAVAEKEKLSDPTLNFVGFQEGARWAREWCDRNSIYKDTMLNLDKQNEKLRTENQRLREALEKAIAFFDSGPNRTKATFINLKQALAETAGEK